MFDPSDDSAWMKFVKILNRKNELQSNLVNYVFQQDVRSSIKKRVMFCLLVPDKEWLKKLWGLELSRGDYYAQFPYKDDFLKLDNFECKSSKGVFSVVDAENAAKLLREFSSALRADRTIGDDADKALRFYGHYQLQLLTWREPKLTDQVFNDFLLNLATAHYKERHRGAGGDGFRLFETALSFEGLRLKWKRKIDRKMRDWALLEKPAGKRLRYPNFSAVDGYGSKIIQSGGQPCCPELFKGQLEFILSEFPDIRSGMFRKGKAHNLLPYLQPGDTTKAIRVAYVRAVLNYNNDQPFVDSDHTLLEAKDLIALLVEESTSQELWNKLDHIIDDGRRYLRHAANKLTNRRLHERKAEDAVMGLFK